MEYHPAHAISRDSVKKKRRQPIIDEDEDVRMGKGRVYLRALRRGNKNLNSSF